MCPHSLPGRRLQEGMSWATRWWVLHTHVSPQIPWHPPPRHCWSPLPCSSLYTPFPLYHSILQSWTPRSLLIISSPGPRTHVSFFDKWTQAEALLSTSPPAVSKLFLLSLLVSVSEALHLAGMWGQAWKPVVWVQFRWAPTSHLQQELPRRKWPPAPTAGGRPHLLGLLPPRLLLQQQQHATGKESEGRLQSDPVHWAPAKEAGCWPSQVLLLMPRQPTGTEAEEERGSMVGPCNHRCCKDQQQEVQSL